MAAPYQPGLPGVHLDGPVAVHRIRDGTSRIPWISDDPTNHTPPPWPDPEAVWGLRRLIGRTAPEVAGLYGWLGYSAAVALRGRRVPVVLSMRDYGNVCAVRTLVRKGAQCSGPALGKCLACAAGFYGGPKGTAAVAGVLWGRRSLMREVRAVHSVSGYVRDVAHRHLIVPAAPEGRLEEVVIPDYVEDEPSAAADPAILARLPSEPFLLFVGQLRLIKGLEILFEAYSRLPAAPPLVLMGPVAPDTPPIPPGVQVIHDVPHPTVMASWSRAMLGVFPSVLAEPLGNAVHEAMRAGCPAIGTRPGGHEDLIEDGRTGLLVPAGDASALQRALQRLIEDPDLRRRLGSAGREAARSLQADRVLPRLLSMFDRARAMPG